MSNDSPDTIEPREVFSKFAELCRIPHGSGNEKALSDYLRDWAGKKGFSVRQDDALNLLIAKPGQHAGAGAPTVILQAHIDMVRAKDADKDFDFETQPIELVVDGERLRANRTTLGADDGIGVAYALAFLDSTDIPHPPLEVLLTTGEETGMVGATAFDASWLTGTIFINIDSETEGVFYTSCAGGARVDIDFAALDEAAPDGLDPVAIAIGNLRGGHSGVEIDKERGNSNRLIARVLRRLFDTFPTARLATMKGGTADNAIPSGTSAVLLVDKNDRTRLAAELAEWQKTFRNELKASDGKPDADERAYDVTVTVADAARPARVLTREAVEKVLFALLVTPSGVAAMALGQPEPLIPETSSNLAMVNVADGKAKVEISVRSQVASKKKFVLTQLDAVTRMLGGTMAVDGDYPGWEFDPDSRIRPIIVDAYQRLTGKTATVQGVHAGLECGIFTSKMRDIGRALDCTSIGPDLSDVHTPDESLDIKSAGRTWELLKEVLGALAKGE